MGFKDYDDDEDVEDELGEEAEDVIEEDVGDPDEEEEEEEEDEDYGSKKRKHRRSQFIDDAAEEDEEEEEEEAPRKRRHRSAAEFIDDTAAVASDEEEEEEDGEDDFIHDDGADLQDEVDARRLRRAPLLDQEDQTENVEDLERMIQQRYGRQDYEDYDDSDATEVEQQALLPSVKDPKLWMLSCMQGHEREAAICLMQKYLDMEAKGEPMLIKSAIALDHLKGYLYVESEKQAYVEKACKGLRTIFQRPPKLVPIKEMTDVLSVEKKSIDIDKENWVRVKYGPYKGDLAKVLDVDHVRQRARIKLVPRIDLSEVLAKLDGSDTNRSKRPGLRPAQRFISLQEVREMKIRVDRKRDAATGEHYDVFANMMFLDGYLVKNVSLKTLYMRDIFPSLDELQKFQKPAENEDADALGLSSSLASRKGTQFMKGDTVVVIEGDLRNLMGVVEKVDEDSIEVRPKFPKLKDNLKFNVKQLSKFFKTGDHVKVISGKHEGATGMIVKVENLAVVLLSDTSKENIRVFKESIVESSEVTYGLTKLGDYELHDLVVLDQTSVGLIVKIETDGCQILKGNPEKQEVVTLKLRDMRKKVFDRRTTALDRDSNVINVKDIVRILDGHFKGKQGSVEHINRGILFVHDRHNLENGGFICVKSRSCQALGGSRGIERQFQTMSTGKPPLMNSRQGPNRGGFSNGYGNNRRGGRRQDVLVGRTVKIRLGPFKGYRGRVVDINDGSVRIELESQMKVVTVRRDQLSDIADTPTSYRESPRYGSGSETPIHPSKTPMHSAFMTPMRDPTATPVHDGMRTPMRDRAWNPYSMTPMRDHPNSDDGWGNRAATPQYHPGTPLANRSYEAPTPGAGWAASPVGGTYSEAGSPSSYGNPASPYVPGTPGVPMTPAGQSYLPSTPGGGQPMTPGTGVFDPTSPAIGVELHEADRHWALPDIVVNVWKHGEDAQTGVIRQVLPDGNCRVALGATGDGEMITVSHSEMELVLPKKTDKIKIVFGDLRGTIGRLVGIDSADGIVRLDETHDVKILDMTSLGKLCGGE